MSRLFFITHPEVVIDPAVPVPDWPLSETGRSRMRLLAESPLLRDVAAIRTSAERKARDGAGILSAALGVPIGIDAALGENDRSATGYIAPPAFWTVVDAFFGEPERSVRGWERAVDAQGRVVGAVERIRREAPEGDVAIVAHGGVGALLKAHLEGVPIGRGHEQPHGGGGCLLVIDRATLALDSGWRVLEDA